MVDRADADSATLWRGGALRVCRAPRAARAWRSAPLAPGTVRWQSDGMAHPGRSSVPPTRMTPGTSTACRACRALSVSPSAAADEPIAERWDGVGGRFRPLISATHSRVDYSVSLACRGPRALRSGRTTWPLLGRLRIRYSDYYVEVFGLWTSGRWSLRPHPNISCSNRGAKGGGDGVAAVSCTSATACIAVGSQIWRWNGSRWSIQPGANRTDALSECRVPR